MAPNNRPSCTQTLWQSREAYALSNGLVQLVHLTGGGHVAEFHFTAESGLSTVSPLWVPTWKTIEPFRYRPKLHAAHYGRSLEGKMLSGAVGHSICLDYFGAPSDAEAAQGLSIHGEAPSAKWHKTESRTAAGQVALTLSVHLPVAGLRFSREVKLRKGESVAYFKEIVINERKADHFFHWTQHVTLGPPFLDAKSSRVAISATRGKTFPQRYDGKALLASSREFRWPFAPAKDGGRVDLSRPLSRQGSGFVVSTLLDPRREIEYVAACNTTHHLLIGYCFRRIDYPWAAVWEENRARATPPWNGRSETRGLEFGSAPFPLNRREAFTLGTLFDTPTFSTVAARSQSTIQYVAFLAHAPSDFGDLRDIELAQNEIVCRGSGATGRAEIRVAASELAAAGFA